MELPGIEFKRHAGKVVEEEIELDLNETQTNLTSIDTAEAYAEDAEKMRRAVSRVKTGEISEEEFKKFRLQLGIYGQRPDQQGFSMVRVKLPYGLLTSSQVRQVGKIARDFADGIAHVTTRQDIQLHWVRLENVPELMETLNEVGLTTREACGNSVRNIVGSPLAGVSSDEAFDVTPYSHLLSKHFLRNELSQTLPRKFKISFSGSAHERDAIIPWIHDIGYVADMRNIDGAAVRGFKVFVGGGLGAQPRVADVLEEFLPAELLIPTTEAIVKVFNDHGNRQIRSKARMKYVLCKLGFEEFKRLVREERERVLASGRTFPEAETTEEEGYHPISDPGIPQTKGDSEFNRWLGSNVFPQRQRGYNAVYVNTTIGDFTADQLFELGRIADKYTNGRMRTTAQQDIVLRWIRSSDIASIYNELRRVGLHQAGAQEIANVTSCPGADTCNLGITHSRALGKELTQLLHRHPDWNTLLKGLRIKISGCPNSCGQHHIAAIGFHGATKKVDGGEIPSYLLSIGGGMNSGKYTFGGTLGRIPARHAPEAVTRIIKRYLSNRTESENFWQFCKRVGVPAFRDDIKDLADLRPEKLTKDLFVDLGQDKLFAAESGEGECAA
jgi:sulfite reductase beta subunit-like hemoprotein